MRLRGFRLTTRGSRLRALAAGVALLALASIGRAEDVAYAFRATVLEVKAPGPMPEGFPEVGAPLTGRFRYDPGRSGRVSETSASYRFRPPTYVMDVDLPVRIRFVHADLNIGLTRNFTGSNRPGAHMLQLSSEMRRNDLGWPFQVSRVRLHLGLWDTRAKALSSLELPHEIDLSDFTQAELRVMGSWPRGGSTDDGPIWQILAKLDALEPVETVDPPEPTAGEK